MRISRNKFKILYDSQGNLLHDMPWSLKEDQTDSGRYVWLPNDPFRETLYIRDDYTSLWKKYVTWETPDGRTFPMFTGDVAKTLLCTIIDHGKVHDLEWLARKSGRQFGIVPFALVQ